MFMFRDDDDRPDSLSRGSGSVRGMDGIPTTKNDTPRGVRKHDEEEDWNPAEGKPKAKKVKKGNKKPIDNRTKKLPGTGHADSSGNRQAVNLQDIQAQLTMLQATLVANNASGVSFIWPNV